MTGGVSAKSCGISRHVVWTLPEPYDSAMIVAPNLHLRRTPLPSFLRVRPKIPLPFWGSDEPTRGQTSRPRREGPGGSEGGVRGFCDALLVATALGLTAAWTGGCGAVLPPSPAPLFTAPLTVEGISVGNAVIDTGGGYEILLSEPFGLSLVDTVEVLAFGGKELVAVTEPFTYTVGGAESTADFALVGLSVCDCNGVGFRFFRKTGTVLALDFKAGRADFTNGAQEGGVSLVFQPPPSELVDFDSAFIEVEVQFGERSQTVLGLLDTGTNASVLRRDLFGDDASTAGDRLDIRISRGDLGIVAAQVSLFDTPGLPDIIIGTDIMRAWSDRWFFTFAPRGGHVTAFPFREEPNAAE